MSRFTILSTLGLALALAGCSTAPKSEEGRDALVADAQSAVARMNVTDTGLDGFLRRSYGYAVFPHVGKGGFIVGGAYGKGVVYESGLLVGYSDLTVANVGAQIGGQTYTEVIAFETRQAFDKFRSGKLSFAADASAVALKSGAAAGAKFVNGVAVFIQPQGGLMAEASIGGQSFSYVPRN